MPAIRALPALVRGQFRTAQEAGDLTFYSTQVSILSCNGLPFQIRFSPALASKPKSNKPRNSKLVDPFENPQKGLFLADLSPTHYLVLNKFPVIPDHFILATKRFQEQTDLLEEEDISAAYECLKAYRAQGEELFGFFNSGEHSGASQPHRHIQFLPVESMRNGIEEGTSWDVLADNLTGNQDTADLPFTYFVSEIPDADIATPSQLHKIYTALYDRALRATQKFAECPGNSFSLLETTRKGESPISYNIGLTDRKMVLCPRVSEGSKIKSIEGDVIGPIALNGTVLGGTLLIKSNEEWQALRNDESKLKEVLQAIGIPSQKISLGERL
ncbi:Diadenosine 5',5'''-P1,P4-tetraphosphate phosphorylase [Lachnellula subtilissima]|uniref:Diadenosine 5',5'''-P1,P4-tetraphosphate phosphorylase n=1 Tax=Lachnellula subtilissima TaxID=602034 RepID=A0A8H8UGK0_9HELO|nr:Diadenosine 5',5'''-P1,P4-tetraphosphate phosphorylase [Lachnellula subtilissima]